ncbi:L-lactate dehydrogenase (cytochrome) [Sporothrix schenckii 1099-18]|uniref:L-lactate dehydrogenase (Cytochrome) n=1 Tax=Sporothrix schenckii 1099-18 TaxID=1397361 RepID=A0A0F2M9X7_SPOSC|nr:L-lactate dehydrogenase (cytochrome) [Sporothrix schenckii 1099-18]KJR85630.1 L-lactate dehydrogenase (cytochrome) [Sporothrix schenckii 1099-18]
MPSVAEVAAHKSRSSCWVIVAGHAYDVTDFLDEHPGGARSILRFAGHDATAEYEPLHPPGTMETLPKDKHLGPVNGAPTTSNVTQTSTPSPSPSSLSPTAMQIQVPVALPLSACMSLEDLAQVAAVKLSPRAAAYYNSGAETRYSRDRNRRDWSRIGLRPRVLINVGPTPKMRTNVMGFDSSLPVFIAPAAHARFGHPDGELCLARTAARMDIAQCVSTYASVAAADIASEFFRDPYKRGGALFFQLYIPRVKKDAEKLIAVAKAAGYQALVVTVDAPVIGKRDDDAQFQALAAAAVDGGGSQSKEDTGNESQALPPLPGQESGTLRAAHNATFEWSDLPWIRQCWGSEHPILLKGVQTAEDALLATQQVDADGKRLVDGIYLSNHGGRQLDYAPTSVRTLLDLRRRAPQVFDLLPVYVDGGVLRGTDVVKALCLGARAVGLGRGFLYALSAYGTAGALRAVHILSDEIQTTLRLLGVADVAELDTRYLDLSEFGIERAKL